MLPTLWYGISSLLLAILLVFPLRKLMLAMSVNRQQRKLGRELTGEERRRLQRKLTVLAAVIAVTFAFFYNKYLLFKLLPKP